MANFGVQYFKSVGRSPWPMPNLSYPCTTQFPVCKLMTSMYLQSSYRPVAQLVGNYTITVRSAAAKSSEVCRADRVSPARGRLVPRTVLDAFRMAATSRSVLGFTACTGSRVVRPRPTNFGVGQRENS
ncbi:unnamed protein product [Calypogeia fissa]